MVLDGCNYFSFWAIFHPFRPLTTQKIKIKKWKKRLDISSFYICIPKFISDDVRFLRYGTWQMDGKSDIQRWVLHQKYIFTYIFGNKHILGTILELLLSLARILWFTSVHSMVDHPMGAKSKILNSFKFLLWL